MPDATVTRSRSCESCVFRPRWPLLCAARPCRRGRRPEGRRGRWLLVGRADQAALQRRVVDTAPPLAGYPALGECAGLQRRWRPASAATTTSRKDLAAGARPPSGFRASGALLIRPAGRVAVATWPGSRARSPACASAAARCRQRRRPGASAPCPTWASATATIRCKTAGASAPTSAWWRRARATRVGIGPRAVGHRRASTTWCATCACRRCCSWASPTRF